MVKMLSSFVRESLEQCVTGLCRSCHSRGIRGHRLAEAHAYMNVLGRSTIPANRKGGEPVVHAGIDRADCLLTRLASNGPNAPARARAAHDLVPSGEAGTAASPPETRRADRTSVPHRPVTGGCNGWTRYVCDVSS